MPDRRSSLPSLLAGLLVSPASAHPHRDPDDGVATAQSAPAAKSDETVVSLKPGEGVEYKLTMNRGAKVEYSWKAEGGVVNYDMHGKAADGAKDEKSYKSERGVAGDKGVLAARSDGGHGWFWRNRGARDVAITLKTTGAYTEIKRANQACLLASCRRRAEAA